MHLSLAVFGMFLMVIPLHWSINYLCSFLCLQVSVCQWAAFAVLRILFQATIHRPCTNKTLNLSPADLLVIIWSIIIFSCCYFYGKSGYMYSNFIFSLKMGKVGRQGREERTCTCVFHPFLMGQDTMSVAEIIPSINRPLFRFIFRWPHTRISVRSWGRVGPLIISFPLPAPK